MKKLKLKISVSIITIIISIISGTNLYSQNFIINFGYYNANQISDVKNEISSYKSDSTYINTTVVINELESSTEVYIKVGSNFECKHINKY